MSVSSTKYRFLSGGSQQIKASELSSEGLPSGYVLTANPNGTWTAAANGGGAADPNLYPFTASVQSFSASVQSFTASVKSFSASVQVFTASVSGTNAFTASINLFTASMNDFTASVSPSLSPILWKWNEVDTSQFRISYDRIGTPTLSVQTGTGAPTLRVTFPSKSSGEHSCFITFSDFTASFVNTSYYRYELRFRMVAFSGSPGEWYSFGPAVLCNTGSGASFRGAGYGYKLNTAARTWKVQNLALTASGNTPTWGTNTNPLATISPIDQISDSIEAKVFARHIPIQNLLTFRHDFFIRQNWIASQNSVGHRGDLAWWTSVMGAFDSGWHTLPLNTCGMTWLGTTGFNTNQYFEFDNIYILRHPMDMQV